MLPWELPRYHLRRKVLKLFGASFHVYDPAGRTIAFCNQKAFRLREDIRLFADESMQQERMWIQARQVIDFAACYDVVDSTTGQKVGALRRRGLASILRDSWEVLDERDAVIAQCQEDSAGLALLRRFVNLIPQTFYLRAAGDDPVGGQVSLRQRFNPFVFKLDVEVPQDCAVDRRLVFATAVLLAAIEGRQED